MDRDGHLTINQLHWAVFGSVGEERKTLTRKEELYIENHLTTCSLCRKLMSDERKINPFYKLALSQREKAAYWRRIDQRRAALETKTKELANTVEKLHFWRGITAWVKRTCAKLASYFRR